LALAAPIVPVSPVADQRISATNAAIIIDFEHNPNIVRINGVLAYQLGSGFLNGYSGGILTHPDGKRIYLDPPSAFTRDSVIPVHAEDDDVNGLDYNFIAAIDQMTTTDDASYPDIIDLDGTNVFVGYQKVDPTTGGFGGVTIYMRKHDPNTAEVEVITGELVSYGRHPTSGNILAFININGVIYVTDAPASDTPVTLTDVSDALDYVPAITGVGRKSQRDKLQFYSVNKYITDTFKTTTGPGLYVEKLKTPYESANPTPTIIGSDPIKIRIPKPTSDPEQSAIYGYYVARVYLPTNTISGGLHFISFPAGADYVDWEDEGRPHEVGYIVYPVYFFSDDQVDEIVGPPTDYLEIPPFLGADEVPATTGVGRYTELTKTQYYRLEKLITDTMRTTTGVGRWFSITVTGFGSKGVGS
jgi:hypothetical protein